MRNFSKIKNSKTRIEVTQSLILESISFSKKYYALSGAFSATTFPL